MINIRSNTAWVAIAWAALCCLPFAVHGQTTVVNGADRVVIDGDYVRVESPEGVTEVSGDWRTGGGTHVTHTDDILVDLGAVEVGDHIRLSLAGDILFELGSAAIDEAAQAVLADVAHVIRDRARGEILIVGHTDALGTAEANLRLSQERAGEVIRWLHHTQGIPGHMLVGQGMGESQPVAHNTTPDGRDNPDGRARNRRVDLYVATTETADVRSAAAVTVNTPSGPVHIHEDRVEVGGVTIDSGGVHAGGYDVSTGGTVRVGGGSQQAEGSTTCSAGKMCNANCIEGDCTMSCSAGANCNYACSGGDCKMLCAAGANCQFSCAGGDCRFTCAMGSTCNTSCLGGDCTRG